MLSPVEMLGSGFAVYAIDDQRVGSVSKLNACCFEVAGAATSWALLTDSVFNVVHERITLVCNAEEVSRYVCGLHHPRLGRSTA